MAVIVYLHDSRSEERLSDILMIVCQFFHSVKCQNLIDCNVAQVITVRKKPFILIIILIIEIVFYLPFDFLKALLIIDRDGGGGYGGSTTYAG